MFRIGDVAEILEVGKTTVRDWTNEYTAFFSANATAQGGKHRAFSERDLAVLHTIATLRKNNVSFADIHVVLTNGELVAPNLTFAQFARLRKREVSEVFLEELFAELQIQLADMRKENSQLRSDLTEVRRELRKERRARVDAEKRAIRAAMQ